MIPVRELVAEARRAQVTLRSFDAVDLIRRLADALEEREQLTEKAQALVAALDACKLVLDGWAAMNYVHGGRYDGPTFGAELETLRAALDAARKETGK